MSALSGRRRKRCQHSTRRTNHRKVLDGRRFVRDCPSPRPDQRRLMVCSPRWWSELPRVSRSMELTIGCVRRSPSNGCVRRPNEKGRFFPFKPSSISAMALLFLGCLPCAKWPMARPSSAAGIVFMKKQVESSSFQVQAKFSLLGAKSQETPGESTPFHFAPIEGDF